MKRYILFLVVLFVFCSCEKVLDFDEGMSPRHMVLNAVPSAGKELFVNFGYSHLFLDTNVAYPVEDADVEISLNGETLHPTRMVGCNYFFGRTLNEDDQLDVRINALGKTITASTYVPRYPQMTTPLCIVDTSDVFSFCNVSFRLTDLPDRREYYCFTLQERDSGARMNPWTEELDTIDTVYNTFFLCLNMPPFENHKLTGSTSETDALGGFFYEQLLASDSLFNGQSIPVAFQILLLVDTNEVEPFIHQYTLNVESMSPDRFRYLKQVSTANSMMQFFTEPSQVCGNVNGGALGLFAGNARKCFPLNVTRPTRPSVKRARVR